jgi:hypothetical protein
VPHLLGIGDPAGEGEIEPLEGATFVIRETGGRAFAGAQRVEYSGGAVDGMLVWTGWRCQTRQVEGWLLT